ncbi:MAG: glucose-6-phosphate isomerase [Gammaproteobacteria bacterium]|nr:glucose-6-phosphate isomerase [Rhodocyclaceae bacterium]MBU3909488.1 glucose-6-phosphate isomerase [Gammaproteobacteria bacterium]MBU3987785.1 glucose-6-phosphate isomerase [Gammaproteobacteria bacterium]MBU4003743.1 glucose-6-phosphate isomerase [Gammaproteobacteria bacterium]MBU4022200.1 glucose-6-phosphate isomerase [Gammaproteobacteria bacterium]
MTPLLSSPAWKNLERHARDLHDRHLRDLFGTDPLRFQRLSVRWNDWLLDLSKQRITPETLPLLAELWNTADVPGWIARMRAGDPLNHTEGRAVLHMALRNFSPPPQSPAAISPQGGQKHLGRPGVFLGQASSPINVDGRDVMPDVRAVLDKMRGFCDAIHSGHWRSATGEPISDIVSIGIGGSDLGPRMATQALAAHHVPHLRVHYVANLDGADLATTLAGLAPRTTLFIIASKTFTTQETMQNAVSARAWLTTALGETAVSRHFVAISTALDRVAAFGIDPDNAFAFWDWVGGRFSVWSAIGLPLALAIGFEKFTALLAGARAMDEHFFSAPPLENLPALLAFIELWNTDFLGLQTRALLPYSESLGLLPRYLQQLEMESLGKQTDRDGQPVGCPTQPIVWGEPGTNGQHAFYQLLHQGGRALSCEFIACREADFPLAGHHAKLLANCFAQSAALMQGKTAAEASAELAAAVPPAPTFLAPYKVFPGNQSSTTLLLPKLDPHTLGALIAMYEHKVFTLGVLWNLNAFDQWGVEYGKQIANSLLPMIEGKTPVTNIDSSTAGLIAACK